MAKHSRKTRRNSSGGAKKKKTRWVERKKPKSQKQYDSTLGYPGEGPAKKLRMCTFNVNGLNEKGLQKMRDLMKWANASHVGKSLKPGSWKFSHDLSHIKFIFNIMVCNIKYHKKVSLSDDNWYNLSNIDFGIPKYQNKIFNKFKE